MGADRGLLQSATRVVAGLGVLGLVLAGCTNDPEPIISTTPTLVETASPTPSASASPSPTPSPSPDSTALTEAEVLAQIPEGLNHESLGAAVDFSRFFITLYPHAISERHEYELLAALSSDDCVFCQESLAIAREAEAAGGYGEGGDFEWPVETTGAEGIDGGLEADGLWYIAQPFSVEDLSMRDALGNEVHTSRGGSGNVTTKLEWLGSHWVVRGVNFEFAD